MKINTHGKKRDESVREVTCHECQCQFSVNQDDCEWRDGNGHTTKGGFVVRCPENFCGRVIHVCNFWSQ